MSDKPSTPNLDKMHEVRDQAQAFFEIIEWLAEETDLRLGTQGDAEWGGLRTFANVGTGRTAQVAVAKYLGVDLDEADRERDRVLEWVQERNTDPEAAR